MVTTIRIGRNGQRRFEMFIIYWGESIPVYGTFTMVNFQPGRFGNCGPNAAFWMVPGTWEEV